MRTNMVTVQCLVKITLVTFMVVLQADGRQNFRRPGVFHELTSPPTAKNAATRWLEVEEKQEPSRNEVFAPPFKNQRVPTTGSNAGCRKRVVCEAARTLTNIIPISNLWKEIVRGRPEPKNAYLAALSKGLLNQDCSEIYPDCSDSAAGMVIPLVSEVVGPNGFLSAFLERLAIPSAPHVPRDPGAPRPSLLTERLRHSKRRWKSTQPWTSSEDFATRRA
ncbi:uncharacterized protein LOC144130455 [Amblyomma americanum]